MADDNKADDKKAQPKAPQPAAPKPRSLDDLPSGEQPSGKPVGHPDLFRTGEEWALSGKPFVNKVSLARAIKNGLNLDAKMSEGIFDHYFQL